MKIIKTKLEKDIDNLLNGNSPWRVIAALSSAYEAKGMKILARKLMRISDWLNTP